MQLQDRRILITGASRGIGRAIAAACAQAGAILGLNYRHSEGEARALQAELSRQYGTRSRLLPFDVRDGPAVQAAVEGFCEAEGGLEGLVNNAGANLPGLLVTADEARLREQLEVNLLGPILCSRAVLPHFLAARQGVIVNLSSVAAERPAKGQAAYAASKGGVESLTRALAVEYGRKGIRVHCVRPGAIQTEMLEGSRQVAGEAILGRIPLGRLGTPGDVAGLVVFLLSEQAGYMTGGVIPVDGGYLEG